MVIKPPAGWTSGTGASSAFIRKGQCPRFVGGLPEGGFVRGRCCMTDFQIAQATLDGPKDLRKSELKSKLLFQNVK